MKKIIATLGLAAILTIGGGGIAAFAEDAPTGDTPSTPTTPATSQTDAPVTPTVSSDPAPSDQPIDSTVAPSAKSSGAKSLVVDTGETKALSWLTTNTTEPTPATVNWPQTKVDPAACGTGWVQNDVYKYGTTDAKATVDGLGDTLTQGEDSSVYISHTFTHQVACPVPPQVCTTGASYHESDDNSGIVTNNGVIIASQGDGKATDFGYSVSGNAQGFTTLDWTATDVQGHGIFARLIFDLSGDAGGPSYASFSGLGTHVDQTTVAGYGSKALFSGMTIADVASTYPHNKLLAVVWQTGSSYTKGEGAVLTSSTGPCIAANFVKPSVVVDNPTAPVTPTADVTALAFTGPGPITVLLALAGLAAIYLGASLRFKALQRPLKWIASKFRKTRTA